MLQSPCDERKLIKSKMRDILGLILTLWLSLSHHYRILTLLILIKSYKVLSCHQTALYRLGDIDYFELDLQSPSMFYIIIIYPNFYMDSWIIREGGTNAYTYIACCRSNTSNIFRLYNLGFSSIDLVLMFLLFSNSAWALISTIIYHQI